MKERGKEEMGRRGREKRCEEEGERRDGREKKMEKRGRGERRGFWRRKKRANKGKGCEK